MLRLEQRTKFVLTNLATTYDFSAYGGPNALE